MQNGLAIYLEVSEEARNRGKQLLWKVTRMLHCPSRIRFDLYTHAVAAPVSVDTDPETCGHKLPFQSGASLSVGNVSVLFGRLRAYAFLLTLVCVGTCLYVPDARLEVTLEGSEALRRPV